MLFENESLTKLLVPFPAQRPSEARSSSPRVPATVSGGGLGAGAPINPVRQLHGFISVGLRNFQEIGQKNRNEGGCGRRSQSKPRIPAVPNADVQGALAPVMKSGTQGASALERIQLGLRVSGRPQQSG